MLTEQQKQLILSSVADTCCQTSLDIYIDAYPYNVQIYKNVCFSLKIIIENR